jgi:hypothetical protein
MILFTAGLLILIYDVMMFYVTTHVMAELEPGKRAELPPLFFLPIAACIAVMVAGLCLWFFSNRRRPDKVISIPGNQSSTGDGISRLRQPWPAGVRSAQKNGPGHCQGDPMGVR